MICIGSHDLSYWITWALVLDHMIFCIGSHDILYWITWSLVLDHMISYIGSYDLVLDHMIFYIGSHDLKSHPQTTFSHEEKRSGEPSGISSNIQTFCDIQEILETPRLAEMQKNFYCCKVIIAPCHITHRPGGAHWLGVRSECNPYSRKLSRQKTFVNFKFSGYSWKFSKQNLGAWYLAAPASNPQKFPMLELYIDYTRFWVAIQSLQIIRHNG